jgi:hypothetical protein
VQRYGADSPNVMSVDDRLRNLAAKAANDAERQPFLDAVGYKPEPNPIFGSEAGEE